MHTVPFIPEHARQLRNYGGQDYLIADASDRDFQDFAERGPALTMVHDGGPIACGGLIACTRFRATAWILVSQTQPAHFRAIHAAAKRMFAERDFRRIEAYVDPRFKQAVRWVRALGFRLERAYIPLFFPDGTGASEWALYPKD